MTGPTGLRKVTVNLTPAADEALTRLAEAAGTSRTEALCRAVRLADVLRELAPDGRLRVRRPGGGVVEVIVL